MHFVENVFTLSEISLQYVPYGLTDNIAALVQIMACHWTGNKPLLETMLVYFTYIYESIDLIELRNIWYFDIHTMLGSFSYQFKQQISNIQPAIDIMSNIT